MLEIMSPEKMTFVHDCYTALNRAYIRLFLTAARTRDPIASHLIGIEHAVLAEYASANSYDLIAAEKIGAPLVRPLLRDPASLRDAVEGKISTADLFSKYYYKRQTSSVSSTNSIAPTPEATKAVQSAICELNEQVIKLVLTVASARDLIAALLLRLDPKTLDAYAAIAAYDVKKITTIGIPLARPILTDPASVRACFTSGCSTSIVLQRLSSETPDIKRPYHSKP